MDKTTQKIVDSTLNFTEKKFDDLKKSLINVIDKVVLEECTRANESFIDMDDDDVLSLETVGETTNNLVKIFVDGRLAIQSTSGKQSRRHISELDTIQLYRVLEKLNEIL